VKKTSGRHANTSLTDFVEIKIELCGNRNIIHSSPGGLGMKLVFLKLVARKKN